MKGAEVGALFSAIRRTGLVPRGAFKLEDGRYGVSGPLLAVGPSGELQAFARRRLVNASSPGERAWWQEVVGALAH